MKLYFISNNEFKIQEAKAIFSTSKIELESLKIKINEIQSEDAYLIVRDKALKAFNHIRRPLFVEHTGLYIEDFGNLPGGLTQVVWDSLKEDKFCDFFGNRKNTNAKTKTILAYCNGKDINIFEGSIDGKISSKPYGNRDFQWDCVLFRMGMTKLLLNYVRLKMIFQ